MNNKMEPYVINLKTELFNIKGHFAYKLFGAKHFRTVECVTFTTKSCKSQESVTKEANLRLSRAGQDLKDHPVRPVLWRTCNRPKACPRPFTHREDYRPVQNSFPPYYGILPFFCWNSMTNSGVCMLLSFMKRSQWENLLGMQDPIIVCGGCVWTLPSRICLIWHDSCTGTGYASFIVVIGLMECHLVPL